MIRITRVALLRFSTIGLAMIFLTMQRQPANAQYSENSIQIRNSSDTAVDYTIGLGRMYPTERGCLSVGRAFERSYFGKTPRGWDCFFTLRESTATPLQPGPRARYTAEGSDGNYSVLVSH